MYGFDTRRENLAFHAWYTLGRAGLLKHIGFEKSAYLSNDHQLIFAIAGRLMILAHNTKWRLSIFRELFRKHPRIEIIE